VETQKSFLGVSPPFVFFFFFFLFYIENNNIKDNQRERTDTQISKKYFPQEIFSHTWPEAYVQMAFHEQIMV